MDEVLRGGCEFCWVVHGVCVVSWRAETPRSLPIHFTTNPVPRPDTIATIAVNKRAFHDFEILERVEAGIRLFGTEVKAVRKNLVRLQGSFVQPKRMLVGGSKKRGSKPERKPEVRDVLHVVNMQIQQYPPAGLNQHDPIRSRELLLNRKEHDLLLEKVQEQGLTLVPLDVHLTHGLVKLTVGLGRGKKLHDKRRVMKEREVKRTLDRAVKQR